MIHLCRRLLHVLCSSPSWGCSRRRRRWCPHFTATRAPAHRQRARLSAEQRCLSERMRLSRDRQRRGSEREEQRVRGSTRHNIKRSWLTQFAVTDGYRLRYEDCGCDPNFVNPTWAFLSRQKMAQRHRWRAARPARGGSLRGGIRGGGSSGAPTTSLDGGSPSSAAADSRPQGAGADRGRPALTVSRSTRWLRGHPPRARRAPAPAASAPRGWSGRWPSRGAWPRCRCPSEACLEK